jgi:hypothetical protein
LVYNHHDHQHGRDGNDCDRPPDPCPELACPAEIVPQCVLLRGSLYGFDAVERHGALCGPAREAALEIGLSFRTVAHDRRDQRAQPRRVIRQRAARSEQQNQVLDVNVLGRADVVAVVAERLDKVEKIIRQRLRRRHSGLRRATSGW